MFQEDWPLPMSFEKPLDNQSDGLLMGTQDDIAAILNEVARILSILNSVTVEAIIKH